MTDREAAHANELRRATAAIVTVETAFNEAADDVERYLGEGFVGIKHTRTEFPTVHLLSRALANLRAGMLLAASGFVIQMCSVVRPVCESLNLIELFQQEPGLAEEWLQGSTSPKEFAKFQPGAVRRELGKGPDPVYSWLSERSHPRLAGAETSAYMKTDSDQVLVIMGGLPLNDPKVLLAAAMPGDLLGQVATAAGHFVTTPAVAVKWPALVVSVTERLQEGAEGILGFLHPEGVPAGSIGQDVLDAHRANVDNARELRDAIDEAVAEQERRARESPG
jgi:hypothetical protein